MGYYQQSGQGRLHHVGLNGKVVYQYMSIEEASALDKAAHTEPLLNMAYTTLLSYTSYGRDHTKWPTSFTEPDPDLLDRTGGGNNTIFSHAKEPIRRLMRRSRFR